MIEAIGNEMLCERHAKANQKKKKKNEKQRGKKD